MGILSRVGIALDSDLVDRFGRSIGRCGYTNRSEAFRDLIRSRLVTEQTADPYGTVAGTVTLIYDHHASCLPEKLMELQRAHRGLVVATCNTYVAHASCLEVLIVQDKSAQVKQFTVRLIGLKGVQNRQLVMTVPAILLERCRRRRHECDHNR